MKNAEHHCSAGETSTLHLLVRSQASLRHPCLPEGLALGAEAHETLSPIAGTVSLPEEHLLRRTTLRAFNLYFLHKLTQWFSNRDILGNPEFRPYTRPIKNHNLDRHRHCTQKH